MIGLVNYRVPISEDETPVPNIEQMANYRVGILGGGTCTFLRCTYQNNRCPKHENTFSTNNLSQSLGLILYQKAETPVDPVNHIEVL